MDDAFGATGRARINGAATMRPVRTITGVRAAVGASVFSGVAGSGVGVRVGDGRNVIVGCGRGAVAVGDGVGEASIAASAPDCIAIPAIANAPQTHPNPMPTLTAMINCETER